MTWKVGDPLVKEPKDMGYISRADAIDQFDKHDWDTMFERDEMAQKGDFYHNAFLVFDDPQNEQEIDFLLVRKENGLQFIVFYHRKKTVKSFFGFGTREKTVLSEQRDVPFIECKNILRAFVEVDRDYLENREWI